MIEPARRYRRGRFCVAGPQFPASVAWPGNVERIECGWPRMAFIERALEDDPTNWWAPDHACVEAMLRAAGFCVESRPGHEIYVCTPNESEAPIPANLRTAELDTIFAKSGEPL